jgi:hypothetical protein
MVFLPRAFWLRFFISICGYELEGQAGVEANADVAPIICIAQPSADDLSFARRVGKAGMLESNEEIACLFAVEMPDRLTVNDHSDRATIVRIVRIARQQRRAATMKAVAAAAAAQSIQRGLVERGSDNAKVKAPVADDHAAVTGKTEEPTPQPHLPPPCDGGTGGF